MKKTVLIFHPDLELSLINFQKEFTKILNKSISSKLIKNNNKIVKSKTFFYSRLPLWLELNHSDFVCENKSQLQKLANNIKNATLLENLKIITNTVYITAQITLEKNEISLENSKQAENTKKNEYFFDLPISTIHNSDHLTVESQKIVTNAKSPIKNIKIFKLGICKQISENTKEIEDFVWAKKNS